MEAARCAKEGLLRLGVATSRRRALTLLGVVAATMTVAAGVPLPARAITPQAGPLTTVIVQHDPDARAAAQRAVAAAGGTAGRPLSVVDAFTASVPASAIGRMRGAPGVRAVTENAPVQLTGNEWLADKDENSLYSITKSAGAHDAWSKADGGGRKITGQGVGVALIDSGVTPVKGLAGAGKVVNGPDLSFESQAPNLTGLDTFGHGTHLAGIIAGRDPEVKDGNENDSKYFTGVAPGSHVASVKVAAADGATDVSQVAAIDWVVAHRRDPGMNIRVLNLSFGTDSTQDPRLDPLSHAVEAAWRNGIVVVAAAGNDGPSATQLSMPAVNLYVIAVGAATSPVPQAT
jgi:serine protease AprX